MNFEIFVAHEAEKILDRLDRPTEQRVRARFSQLRVDPSIRASLLRSLAGPESESPAVAIGE